MYCDQELLEDTLEKQSNEMRIVTKLKPFFTIHKNKIPIWLPRLNFLSLSALYVKAAF